MPDLDPVVEGVVEVGRPRRRRPLRGRELRVQAAIAAAFVAASAAMAIFLPGGRPWSVGTAIALVAAFAVVSRIEFDELMGHKRK